MLTLAIFNLLANALLEAFTFDAWNNGTADLYENEIIAEPHYVLSSFDYIVVGGGASGIAGAYTLAEAGKRVLILERGQERGEHPLSHDLSGVGIVLNDVETEADTYLNSAVRLVHTSPSGVISHTANLIGGGNSVNMGILLHEGEEYWDDYIEQWDFPIADKDRWMESHRWVTSLLARPVPPIGTEDDPTLYDIAVEKAMKSFYSAAGTDILEARSEIVPGQSWKGQSLFDYSIESQPRNSIDQLLSKDMKPDNLSIMTNAEVEKLTFPDENVICVNGFHYVATMPMCPFVSYLPGFQFIFKCARINSIEWIKIKMQYCVKAEENRSGVILAAGTLSSPLILMRSGIGPEDEVKHHPNPIVDYQIGMNLTDRYMTFVSLYGYKIPDATRILTHAALARLPVPENSEISAPDWPFHQIDGAPSDLPTAGISGSSSQFTADNPTETIIENPPGSVPEIQHRTDSVIESTPSVGQAAKLEEIYAPWEDLGGGDIIAGVGMATRNFFPPAVRNDPNIALWASVQAHCLYKRFVESHGISNTKNSFLSSEELSYIDQFVTNQTCLLLDPLLSCYRYTRAVFTMESTPYSRGHVKLSEQSTSGSDRWTTHAHMPYLDDPRDRLVHVESVKHLWKSLASIDEFSELTEPIPDQLDCPIPIIHGILSFLMGDLIHPDNMKLLKVALGLVGSSVFDIFQELWSARQLGGQELHNDVSTFEPKILSQGTIVSFLEYLEDLETETKDTRPSISGLAVDDEDEEVTTTSSSEFRGITKVIPWAMSEHLRSMVANSQIDPRAADDCDIPFNLRYRSMPPLPCKITDEAAFAYITNYGTSLWHWLGSLRRGSKESDPVDESYQLRKKPGVYVIDGSVYPHNPRMNPQISVMAGARYAAQTIIDGSDEANTAEPNI